MSKARATVLPDPEPITLKQLRSVIPAHCFERSYVKSFSYIIRDVSLIIILMYFGNKIEKIPLISIRIISWMMYWFSLGSVMTGLWVIAHECGHQAFSPSLIVNDTIGSILHTILLVPYWSWKYSHAQHHGNTNSMEHDSVFVPNTDLTTNMDINIKNACNQTKIGRLWGICKMVSIGWIMYLCFNLASSKIYDSNKHFKWNSHFNPFCSLWKTNSQRIGVIASDVLLIIWCFFLYQLGCIFSFTFLIQHYFIPYLWVNFWLVTITFLQHTDWIVPKFFDEKWTWLRGVFGTVDRDYGFFNFLHHHIADTHVLHHIFSQIPHYHAQEATAALLNSHLIDDYYLFDSTPWYIALWFNYSHCCYVRHDQPVTWFESYKNKPHHF